MLGRWTGLQKASVCSHQQTNLFPWKRFGEGERVSHHALSACLPRVPSSDCSPAPSLACCTGPYTAHSSSLADAPSSPPVPACHSNVFFRISHLSFHAHWGIWELFGSALLWDLSAPHIKINGMNHARAGCLRHVRLWLPIIFQPVFQFQPSLTEGQMMLGHKVPTGSVKTDIWIEEIGKVTARKAAGSAQLSWDRSIP